MAVKGEVSEKMRGKMDVISTGSDARLFKRTFRMHLVALDIKIHDPNISAGWNQTELKFSALLKFGVDQI